ncbi:hypothetical protein ASG32_31360 [Methylobacterium sp. Leaf361]|uniref:hypothetical protein n=1 Tax=Methylobacterium sp. Leaf361 TaxID=1736352 RepID=UPI0006FBAA5C|nr:hypothetical protein [Methylobacterium sp. Leaf361]KQS59500.1 hypothetical protein ASG32_31360 [Methylobacterium sp. Leaf361]
MRYRTTKTLHVQTAIYAAGEMFDPVKHDLPQAEIDWLLKQEAIEVLKNPPAPQVQNSRGR